MLRVRDPYLSFRVAKSWFGQSIKYLFIILILIAAFSYFTGKIPGDVRSTFVDMAPQFIALMIFLVPALCIFSILVFIQYYRGITLDENSGEISMPAPNDPNTITDIITLQKYRKHLSRISVPLESIIDIRNNTEPSKYPDRFKLDIIYDNGGRSHKIEFSSKQRRDQCRALILNAVKISGKRVTSDLNSSY